MSLTAAATLISTGAMTCFAWNNAVDNNTVNGRRDFEAAGALGVFTIATGVLYLLDFFWVIWRKFQMTATQQEYYN